MDRPAGHPARPPVPASPVRQRRHARLPDRSHRQPRSLLRRRPPARPHPDGHRRRKDLHRRLLHLPAHQARRCTARAVPGGSLQPRRANQGRVRPVRAARRRPQVHAGLQPTAPHLELARLRRPRHRRHHPARLFHPAWRRTARRRRRTLRLRSGKALGEGRTKDVAYNPAFPVETFDFIVTDECHRSIYNLWRQVLEYFDASLIGLTATPSKQTIGFFDQNLVMEYGHDRAVATA